jgi:hypothetical protein
MKKFSFSKIVLYLVSKMQYTAWHAFPSSKSELLNFLKRNMEYM